MHIGRGQTKRETAREREGEFCLEKSLQSRDRKEQLDAANQNVDNLVKRRRQRKGTQRRKGRCCMFRSRFYPTVSPLDLHVKGWKQVLRRATIVHHSWNRVCTTHPLCFLLDVSSPRGLPERMKKKEKEKKNIYTATTLANMAKEDDKRYKILRTQS